jgi:hypothetical protein
MVTRRPSLGIGARIVDALGADPNITELRGPICDPAHEAAVYVALLDELDARAADWDWMHLRGVRVGSAADGVLADRGDLEWTGESQAYVLALPPTW